MKLSRLWYPTLCIFYLICPDTRGLSLYCYRPYNASLDVLTDYVEVMVDCSGHKFKTREDLAVHQSHLCTTEPSLCEIVSGFDYSSNAIRQLGKPKYEFKMVEKLIFKKNAIEFIDDDAFNTEYLQLLDLSYNKISGATLRENVFRGKYNQTTKSYENSSLEKLFLSYNEIEFLNPHTFRYLKKLSVLELNNNPLSVIGDSTRGELQSLTHLHVLHLGSTNLSSLPFDMFNGMQLTSLYLNGNRLTRMPYLTALGDSLLNFNVDDNLFEELNADSFSSLSYLTSLNMSGNHLLRSVHKNTFRPLVRLQVLYLNFNARLSYIDPYAFNMGWNLRELYLNNDALTSLPHELGDWDNLEVLDIQSNPWTCDCSVQWLIDYVAKRQRTEPELNYNLYCFQPTQFHGSHLLSNSILSHISNNCGKGALAISSFSEHVHKLYPLLFVMSLLLLTMLTYLVCSTIRYLRSHVPYVCNYSVTYNKLPTTV